jgi:hypothetical protein
VCNNWVQIKILKVVHNVFSRQNKFMDPRVHCGRSDFEKVLKEFEFLFNPNPSTAKSILTYYVSEYLRTMKLKLYCLVTTFGHFFSLWTLLVIAIKLAEKLILFSKRSNWITVFKFNQRENLLIALRNREHVVSHVILCKLLYKFKDYVGGNIHVD